MPTHAWSTVALVLDHELGEGLVALAARAPVWVVNSETNGPVIRRLRAEGREVTTFDNSKLRSPEELGAGMVATIDRHHGGYDQHPVARRLEVYGAALTDDFRRVLCDFDFHRFESILGGFVAIEDDPA